MEKLQLDPKGMHLIDGTDAFQQVKPGFPGESEDQVNDKGKLSGMELCCSIIKYGGRIPPADPCCSVVMNGLQTKLDPDKPVRIQQPEAVKSLQNDIGKAIRARRNGNSCDLRRGKCFFITGKQSVRITISVGICLKIGDQRRLAGFRCPFGGQKCLGLI